MEFYKTLYISSWESEYDVYIDKEKNMFYLVANENTNYSINEKETLEQIEGKYCKDLSRLSNYFTTTDNVEDVIEYNEVVCYVIRPKEPSNTGYYYVLPSFDGPGMVMDNYYACIGNYGEEPTFIKLTCVVCGEVKYFDTLRIPEGEKYCVKCNKCGYMFMRKKV